MTKAIASLVTALTLVSVSAAHAGVNMCSGTVSVGKEWTTVTGSYGNGKFCRVKTDSKLGRRIIEACPDGSKCFIDVGLSKSSSTLTDIDSVIREIESK